MQDINPTQAFSEAIEELQAQAGEPDSDQVGLLGYDNGNHPRFEALQSPSMDLINSELRRRAHIESATGRGIINEDRFLPHALTIKKIGNYEIVHLSGALQDSGALSTLGEVLTVIDGRSKRDILFVCEILPFRDYSNQDFVTIGAQIAQAQGVPCLGPFMTVSNPELVCSLQKRAEFDGIAHDELVALITLGQIEALGERVFIDTVASIEHLHKCWGPNSVTLLEMYKAAVVVQTVEKEDKRLPKFFDFAKSYKQDGALDRIEDWSQFQGFLNFIGETNPEDQQFAL